MIRIDEEHRYWLGEARKSGFTEIITDLGIKGGGAAFYTDDGRAQGIALHGWLLFLAQGKTTDQKPEDGIAGRVEGIRRFLAESGFVFEGGEQPQYEPRLDYACTPDLWGHLGAFSVVIDAKRGAKEKWHPLQTAAQKLALAANGFKAQRRFGLYLKDGGYSLEAHEDAQDENRWRAIVSAYHAKGFYVQGAR